MSNIKNLKNQETNNKPVINLDCACPKDCVECSCKSNLPVYSKRVIENKENIKSSEELENAQNQVNNKFGKFSTAEKLFEAYNNLEKEFTKQNHALYKERDVVKELQDSLDCAKKELAIALERLENILCEEEFIETCSNNEDVFNRVVEKFLGSRRDIEVAPVLTSRLGQAAASRVTKPKTLEDAKRLALKMLGI